MAVPLTILTGFLGAGKTSLLRYIMTVAHGIRVAIIMNEFGEDVAGLEHSRVMPDADSDTPKGVWLNLPNGCLCCAGVDRGLRAIDELLDSRPEIEWIVLESSGMADPCSLISRLWGDAHMKSYLDGVVCVVDGSRPQLYQQARDHFRIEAVKQVAVADLVIINKLDLIEGHLRILTELEDAVQQLAPAARVIKTSHSSVPLSHLFNLQAFSGMKADMSGLMRQLCLDQFWSPHSQLIYPLHLHLPNHLHIDFASLESWLFSLLWEQTIPNKATAVPGRLTGRIYRVKGHSFDGSVHRYIQAVEQVYDCGIMPLSTSLGDGTFLLITGTFDDGEVAAITSSFYGAFSQGFHV